MLKHLWISIPLSLICALSHANTTTVATPAATNTLAPTAAAATTDAAATSTTAPKAEEAPKAKFGMGVSVGYSIKAQAAPDGTRDESMDYSFTPNVGYGNYTAMLFMLYSQDIKNSANSAGFIDPSLFFSRKSIVLNDYLKLGPGVSVTLPMTDNSKNNVNLMYNLGASASLSLNTKTLGLDSWSLSYYLGYNRNFTKYDTNLAGDPLTMQRIRQRINVGYKFTDNLSLATRFELDSNYSAEGIVRNKFLHYETFSYGINDTVSVSAGHTNSNALLNGKTYESNLKFYDDASSQYSVGLDISI